MKYLCLVALLLICFSTVRAQESEDMYLVNDNIEELYSDEEDDDWDAVIEDLNERIQNPIDINSASREELEQLPFLTDIQIENLLAYVYIHGPMVSLNELQAVEEMDYRTIQLMLRFVCLKPVADGKHFPRLKNILKHGKHEAITRLDIPFYTRQGYTDGDYLGSKYYHSLRYAFSYGDYVKAGITAEKDAGEPLFALHNDKGYDYYSPYLLIRSPGRLRTLALGNYRLSFGLGLVMNGDLSIGKSFSLPTSTYRSSGIKKHSSTGEYSYFRGAALTVNLLRRVNLTAFYSHRDMDGVVSDGEITSILKTGLHRTQSEADKVHQFTLQAMGGNLSFDNNRLHVAATGLYYFFNHRYSPTLRTYAQYNLQGQHFYNLGIDYRIMLGRLSLTGEAAVGKKGYALLNRLTYSVRSTYRLALIHRLYTSDYWAFYARGFSDGTSTQNENGWYLAAEASPFSYWNFFASVDLISFPWWKYRISKSSQAVDVMFKSTFTPSEACSMYLTYRYKRKERDVTGTSGASISPTFHHKLRYRLNVNLGDLTLRTTADFNHFRQQNVDGYEFDRRIGWICTQMLAYKHSDFPLSGSIQASYFRTDDYDSRVYAYERGLLNIFYTPSYYGRGYRYSAVLRCDVGKTLMLMLKFGQTVYLNRDTISSGNDLINSNKKADLQLQLRVKI